MKKQIRLANWLAWRYSILWEEFQDKPFRMEDATKVLEEKGKDKKQDVRTFLSQLSEAGWLCVEHDPQDFRKRIYTLKSKEEMIKELFGIDKSSSGQKELKTFLEKEAVLMRADVDHKFVISLLFLKKISDKWEMEYNEILKEATEDTFEGYAKQERDLKMLKFKT